MPVRRSRRTVLNWHCCSPGSGWRLAVALLPASPSRRPWAGTAGHRRSANSPSSLRLFPWARVRVRGCFPALEAFLTRNMTPAVLRAERLPPGAGPQEPAALWAVLLLLPLAGCAVGPDFKKPDAPQVSDYTPHPVTTTASDGRDRRRGAALRQGRGHRRRLVDAVSFPAAQRPDRPGADEQSRSEGGAGGAAGRRRKHALAGRGAFFPQLTAASPPRHHSSSPGRWRRCPATTPFTTTCSRRRSTSPTCRMCSACTRRTVESLHGAGRGGALSR